MKIHMDVMPTEKKNPLHPFPTVTAIIIQVGLNYSTFGSMANLKK
jgi:hypothetical protein